MSGNRVIMGLDVSTHCIGMTIAKFNGDTVTPIHITHLRPKIPTKVKGTEALFMKSDIFNEELEKYSGLGITDVVIEEPLIGSNNSLTVSTLLRYNGMISQSVYSKLGIVPVFISSYDARKYAMPELMSIRKFDKKGEIYTISKIRSALKKKELVLFGSYPYDCAKKHILWNYISELYPNIEWVYDKDGKLKDENFDASDSMVCVLGFANKEKFNSDEPVITETKEESVNGVNVIRYTVSFCGQEFHKSIEIPSGK